MTLATSLKVSMSWLGWMIIDQPPSAQAWGTDLAAGRTAGPHHYITGWRGTAPTGIT